MSSVNIYLKMKLAKGGPVKGSSTVKDHEGDVLLHTIRWGEENTGVIGGKGGNVIVRNFEFTKTMCPASVQLLLACASGDVVQEAVISCRASNTKDKGDFLKWTLGDGVVCLYEMEAAAEKSVVPSERVCIRFRTLTVEFRPRQEDGNLLGSTLTARLDLGVNTASS